MNSSNWLVFIKSSEVNEVLLLVDETISVVSRSKAVVKLFSVSASQTYIQKLLANS